MNGQARPRRRPWGIVAFLLVAIGTIGMGVLHVARSREEFALRRGVWYELKRLRELDADRARVRQQVTELLAIPRTAVKAEVMGLKPVGQDQVLDLERPEE